MKIIEDYNLKQLEHYGFMDVAEYFYSMLIDKYELTINKITREILINDELDVDKLLKIKIIQQMLKDKIILFENN